MDFYYNISKFLVPIITFSNFIIISIFIIYFLYLNKRNNIKKIFLILVTIIFFLISIYPGGNFFLNKLESNYINKINHNSIDAILVLGGSENTRDTKKTGTLNFGSSSERHIETIVLSNKYPNAMIIFSGTGPVNQSSESYVANLFYKKMNVDMKRVIYTSHSRNTLENIKNYSILNKTYNFKNVILVTSAYHMKRSILIADLIGVKLIPYAVDFRTSNKIRKFYKIDLINSMKKFDLFFKEVLGILYIKIFYN